MWSSHYILQCEWEEQCFLVTVMFPTYWKDVVACLPCKPLYPTHYNKFSTLKVEAGAGEPRSSLSLLKCPLHSLEQSFMTFLLSLFPLLLYQFIPLHSNLFFQLLSPEYTTYFEHIFVVLWCIFFLLFLESLLSWILRLCVQVEEMWILFTFFCLNNHTGEFSDRYPEC